jgi:hypothetical protein
MFSNPDKIIMKTENNTQRKSAQIAEKLIEEGFLLPIKEDKHNPPDKSLTNELKTSEDESTDYQKKKKIKKNNKEKISDMDIQSLLEASKDTAKAMKRFTADNMKNNENISMIYSRCERMMENQNNQICQITEQMRINNEKMEHLNCNVQSQAKVIEVMMNRITILENKAVKECNLVGKGEKKFEGEAKQGIKIKISDPNLEAIKNKERNAYENFLKKQKETPPCEEEGWIEGGAKPKKKETIEKSLRVKKIQNYKETQFKIKSDINHEMAIRIMGGKSPYQLEKVRMVYFSGFKKNRVGYIRTVLCEGGIPNDALLSISFIGFSVLEVIVKESKVQQLVEKCSEYNGTWLKDFNPLKAYNGRKEGEDPKTKITDPKTLFIERLNRIIAQGRGPLNLIRIIRNSDEETITRFLTGSLDLKDWVNNNRIRMVSEDVILHEPQL